MSGSLFSVKLIDSSKTDIKATMFNDVAKNVGVAQSVEWFVQLFGLVEHA